MLDFSIENEYFEKGYRHICGVDEAGRGCLCGPVYAAAVILPTTYHHPKLNDSKKLSPKMRDALYDDICQNAIAYAVATADVAEIEQLNILNATMLAMRRAVTALQVPADIALVDGNIARDFPCAAQPIIHGDAVCMSIAAASILAKVSRDRYMMKLDTDYPQYGIAQHKGYGTALHVKMLQQHGPSEIHRPSFLKKIL